MAPTSVTCRLNGFDVYLVVPSFGLGLFQVFFLIFRRRHGSKKLLYSGIFSGAIKKLEVFIEVLITFRQIQKETNQF